MRGEVRAHHALLRVPFRLPNLPDLEIECVIDTGFTGFLTMPLTAVQKLNLPFIRRIPANLADDSTITVDVYVATIVWGGVERDVEVLATGKRPLLGTLLLDGYEITAQFTEGGSVALRNL